MKRVLVLSAYLLLAVTPAAAQEASPAAHEVKCDGPVYKQSEVSRKAAIKHKPDPGFTEEARANNTSGTVSLAAVLCHTGRITDMRVLQGLPHGLTEQAVAAASRVEFTPAEKDGRPVATHVRFEYNFNTGSSSSELEAPSARHNNRLVEELLIEGNRRQRDEDILYHIQTRPGGPFNVEQVQRDLQALLAMPFFDKTATRVAVEEGPRGGVRVVFNVKELPIIRDLTFTFEGLRGVTEPEVLGALREGRVNVCKECLYNPAHIARAKEVIRQLLAARGWPDATVEVWVEEISQVSVTLSFVIEGRR